MKRWTTQKGSVIIQVLAGRSNVYLVKTGGMNILVDTGRKKYRTRLLNRLHDLGISQVHLLVLTHTHFDHSENAAYLKNHFNLKIMVHAEEKSFLEKGRNTQVWCIIPGLAFLIDRMIPFALRKNDYEPAIADLIVEGEQSPGELPPGLRILHTPGHSMGSVSLLVDDEIALVGDLIFGVVGISSVPPFADNPLEMIRSWKKVMDSGVQLILTGHGHPRTLEKFIRHYSSMKERWM